MGGNAKGDLISDAERRWRFVVGLATDVLGPLSGAAAALTGGTPDAIMGGTAAGITATQVLKAVGMEMAGRLFTRRQSARLGAAYRVAERGILARLAMGEEPRSDGFFTEGEGERAAADEMLEGVYLASVNAFEEKKIPYIANIAASMCFSFMSPAEGNILIHHANALTYRSLVCLSLAGRSWDYALRPSPLPTHFSDAVMSVLNEIMVLFQTHLVGQNLVDGGTLHIESSQNFVPSALKLYGMGRILYRAMRLDLIPRDDVEELVARFLR